MTDPVLSRYRAEILRIAAEHGAKNVRVFGTRARGQVEADSDIDLLLGEVLAEPDGGGAGRAGGRTAE